MNHADAYQDIREAARDMCGEFPAEYFRKIDAERGYPEAFVDALTKAGWLAALIPQEYGGSGLGLTEASAIMEEINRAGGNSGACHGQVYNMGTLLRHASVEAASLMRFEAERRFDAREPCGAQANMAKLLAAAIAAGMYAYTNILAALLERSRTGRGRHIDVSMLESMVEWMSYPLYCEIDGQPPPRQAGASHATIFPYGPFTAGHGKTVMLGLQNEHEWMRFCETVIRMPELAADERFGSNSRRVANRDELAAVIVRAFSTLTAADVIDRLEQAGIANSRMNDMHGVWTHEQLAAHIAGPALIRLLARSLPCCRPVSHRAMSHAWIRCRRSASIPMPCCANSAMPMKRFTRCTPPVRSDRAFPR